MGEDRVLAALQELGLEKVVTRHSRAAAPSPFGSSHQWPVIADAPILRRRISMGGGAHECPSHLTPIRWSRR